MKDLIRDEVGKLRLFFCVYFLLLYIYYWCVGGRFDLVLVE